MILSPINLSNDIGSSLRPIIAVSGNIVHAVWDDDTNEIFYKKSTDGGATFGPTINLSNNHGQSVTPSIAVSGNNVHVVWADNTPGNFDIFYKRSTDGGASFIAPEKNLSNNAGLFSGDPAVAVSDNIVHVVWDDDTDGDFDILYRRSVDGGSTFPNIIKNLSSNFGVSSNAAIALSGNNVYVVWSDNSNDTPGNIEILYRTSADNGSTFPALITNLSTNTAISQYPAIAVT